MSAEKEIALREGLKANLDTIAGVQVSAWPLSNPTPPAIDVVREETEYDRTMGSGGHDDWNFTVRAFVAFTSDVGAQKRLAEICADVKAAIEADKTLGGAADTLRVTRQGRDQQFARESGGPVLGREFHVFVMAAG